LPDDEIDLADAALQLARIGEPDADWQAARAHLSELARAAADLSAIDLDSRAAALTGLLVGRYHYVGDAETYDDLDNANLIRVIERRQGLPVALGILWLHAAHAAGWTAHGVNFPGHFLIVLSEGSEFLPVDVFAGGAALDATDLRELVKRALGPNAELGADMLAPMDTRDVLLRLQVNIKSRLLQHGQLNAAVACLEDMLRFAPHEALLWQEAALLHQQLSHFTAALRCFEQLLKLSPSGAAAARARVAMRELRGRLN